MSHPVCRRWLGLVCQVTSRVGCVVSGGGHRDTAQEASESHFHNLTIWKLRLGMLPW